MLHRNSRGFVISNLIVWIVLGVATLLFIAFIAAGTTLWNGRIKESVNPISLLGNIRCTSWEDAPSGYQTAIEEAANKVGIQPALLGAIFMSEWGDSIKASAGTNGIWGRGGNAQGPFQIENFDGKWSSNVYKKYSDKDKGDPNNFTDSALVAAAFIKNTLEDKGIKADGSDEKTVKATGMLYNRGPVRLEEWKKMGFPLDKAPANIANPGWEWGAAYPNPGGPGYALRTWKNFQGLNNGCISLASVTTSLIPNSLLCKVDLNLGYKSSPSGLVQLPELEKYYHKYASASRTWGKPSLINIIIASSKQWSEAGMPKLQIGDLNAPSGHHSHKRGIDVDIQLPGHMMGSHENPPAVNKNYGAADKQMMIDLAKILINCGATTIGYDDQDVIAAVNTYAIANNKPGRMVAWAKHKAHFHLRIEQS